MDYCARFIDLPFTTKGVTVEDAEGFYNIYINARLSSAEQKKAMEHEIQHLMRKDFDTRKSLQDAESF